MINVCRAYQFIADRSTGIACAQHAHVEICIRTARSKRTRKITFCTDDRSSFHGIMKTPRTENPTATVYARRWKLIVQRRLSNERWCVSDAVSLLLKPSPARILTCYDVHDVRVMFANVLLLLTISCTHAEFVIPHEKLTNVYFPFLSQQLDLQLQDEGGGDISSFITNGEWELLGNYSRYRMHNNRTRRQRSPDSRHIHHALMWWCAVWRQCRDRVLLAWRSSYVRFSCV